MDAICGDELVSDAFKLVEVDDIAYEVDCKTVQIKKGVDVDIGANASAEGEDADDTEDGVESVNNVVYAMRLQGTQFDKKSYMAYIKGYMKAVEAHLKDKNPERVDGFKKSAQTFIKKILENFKDYEFFTGENMNPDGMVVLLNYREDGVTPYLTFFKDGLIEEKM